MTGSEKLVRGLATIVANSFISILGLKIHCLIFSPKRATETASKVPIALSAGHDHQQGNNKQSHEIILPFLDVFQI